MANLERVPFASSGIFFDSANLSFFERWYKTGILGGATTNPVILQKDEVFNIPEHIDKMVAISGPNFPISIEIPDSRMPEADMVELALKYRDRFPDNAVIKVPMDPRDYDKPNGDSEKALRVIYRLGQEGVKVNATIGITMGQLVTAAEAIRNSKAQGNNYVSLFWARRDEAKQQIIDLKINELKLKGNGDFTEENENNIREKLNRDVPDAACTLAMTLDYLNNHSLAAKVIVGSIRNVGQIEQAFKIGADIVTIPPKLLTEWMYTQRGVETADQFNDAYQKVSNKITLI